MDTQSTADIFNKVALATVAIIGAVVSPILQWRIAKRQTLLQEQIAEQQATLQDALATQQVDLQRRIAERQVADNISAKRQVWIDELRADVAEYLANIARIEELRRPPPNLSAEQSAQNFEDFAEANKRATELGIRIKLRLNPREDEHNQFVNLLKTLAEVCKDPPANESDAQKQEALELFSVARDNVVAHLQLILKHEWERIKRGAV
jgi:type II secretory pathway pseudopilin PulG